MTKRILLSLTLASSLFADAELDDMKEQIKQQELKTAQLEQKLAIMEQGTTNRSASFSQNAYLPEIALILNMSALARDVSNSAYAGYEIPGFSEHSHSGTASTGHAHGEIPYNKNRGVNLNYAEVAMGATVDPYFDAYSIFHISEEGLEIEEAYMRTRAMPYDLRVKAGKFKSSFGRRNQMHHHTWDFASQAIIYETFFGAEGLGDVGIQTQWIAPTDTYLMLGVDVLQGSNEKSFGGANGLYVPYIKSSVDIGEDVSILGGVSMAYGDNEAGYNTTVYGADLDVRYQIDSYSSINWLSEYLHRTKEDDPTHTDEQAGLYTQVVYKYNQNYGMGVRYDLITKNDGDLDEYIAHDINTDNLDKITFMLEYKPFEMSRFRLQYSHDRTKVIDEQRRNVNEVMLTLNISTGAHSAHNY